MLNLVIAACLGGIMAGDAPSSSSRAADTVVVCPDVLRPALEPWLVHRRGQGHVIRVLPSADTDVQVRAQIRQVARGGQLRAILLVGDAVSDRSADGSQAPAMVPTHLAPAQVNIRWGSEPQIATDNWYADLDDDQVPDVAIGRLPADTPQQLTSMVEKILQYECRASWGAWRRKIHFVAGVGGFGPLTDAMLETSVRSLITAGIPNSYFTSMTYASWRSPYCPVPAAFRETTISRLNDGCLFWVYVGHGHRRNLDWLRLPEGAAPILEATDAELLKAAEGAPIALFLSCYAGAFDDSTDCLAECMVAAPGGPVAAIAGSRVTMPYAMAILGTAMMHETFEKRRATLGEILLHSKRSLVAPRTTGGARRKWLDMLAGLLSPDPELLEAERQEHLKLFQLLGDPLLRIQHPQPIEFERLEVARAGDQLRIAGTTPVGGQALVELVCQRGHFTFDSRPRQQFDNSPMAERAWRETYRRANDDRWSARRLQLDKGTFETELPIPVEAQGLCHVRLFVQGQDQFAMGATDVRISPAEPVKESPREEPIATTPGG